jgi:hypothetical protein
MRYVLVLQWSGSTETDFDELISMEDALVETSRAAVDGHDFGSGEMNLFVNTDQPAATFTEVAETLGNRPRWLAVRAAYREASGDDYTILWPEGLQEFSVK